uniref:Prostaglandin E2 receptor EP3 subtype n=1 Tax=Knipowitschia caucasica TaxID=637954 RepID=A0AAV2KZN9_KNICA
MCVLLICWSPLLVLMLRMISRQISSHECNSTGGDRSVNLERDYQLDCKFFLTAIRLASLNQILDPWVYLLLREILLRKVCLMANAVSNCSIEERKDTRTALDALNKQNQDNENLQKPQSS